MQLIYLKGYFLVSLVSARTAGRPAGSHCACIGSIFWGSLRQKRKKYFSHFGVLMLQTRPGGWGGSSDHQNKTAPLPILLLASGETQKIFWCARSAKNILVYLCSRPALGRVWGFWHSYHQNKSVPEPPLPILLHLIFVKKTNPCSKYGLISAEG